ncbi:Siderophore synthetase component [Lentibacillus persicus]|uniref:Siderophore synthetase component n=1 Tax=Lentibacillus persicus TaxID=640948 RepID=A0A1I2AY65_9BACI|nr:IucA/IucC family protein [Lentibacillus persicus]SFE47830.1 Siderophore synthetase component [Lentibacillus persicus]
MNSATFKRMAEHATLQSYLNCFLRETGFGDVKHATELSQVYKESHSGYWLHCYLKNQQIHLYVPLSYWSETGRHLFINFAFYQIAYQEPIELDYISLVHFTTKELSLIHSGSNYRTDELLLRVIQSEQIMEQFIKERWEDKAHLSAPDFTFLEAEQSLIYGHLLHPTPKSRQGFSEEEMVTYSPEMKGAFPLHYYRIHNSYIYQDSMLDKSTVNLLKQMVREDPEITNDFKNKYAQMDDYALLPLHPWQASFINGKKHIANLKKEGIIEDLGQTGRSFYPTSSIRTLYHPDVSFMCKFSLNIKVTNSVRANLWKELERGLEVNRIINSEIGSELNEKYPNFSIISDPAFITLQLDGMKETGFEVILRDNPFMGDRAEQVTPIVALGQGSIDENKSRLSMIITNLAKQENATKGFVSEKWFRRYLDISFSPIMWLYFKKGIALEAHQQNSVVRLKDGYPSEFYYRDNQGYYFVNSNKHYLEKLIPGFNQKSDTVCADEVADERLRYYFFVNHLFGLINAFGTAGLIDESRLIKVLRDYLLAVEVEENHPSGLLESLLQEQSFPSKANLLTRLHDMDELVGAMESQSVYVSIANPLYGKEGSKYEPISTSV